MGFIILELLISVLFSLSFFSFLKMYACITCCLYVMKDALFSFFFLLKSLDTLRVPTDACCVSLATEKKGKPERSCRVKI